MMADTSKFQIQCPQCGARHRLPPQGVGKRVRCVKCRAVFKTVIPGKGASAGKPVRPDPPPASQGRTFHSGFPDAPPLGHVIGDCLLVDHLGEGGMGIVYKAVRQTLRRPVALKILPKSVSQRSPEYARRFAIEAQLAANLRHQNIVLVYNAGHDGDYVFMEMEFVEGKPLTHLLKEGPLSEREAIRITRDAAHALDYAHGLGVIHRDVKPENILLTNQGEVKITDFGVAGNVWNRRERGLVADAKHAGDKTGGAIMGTPKYMSPQQCRGEPVDGRTDVYALGATCYALLAGRPPFDDEDTVLILHKQQTDTVPDIRDVNPRISEPVWNALQKALAKDLEERFSSCSEFAAALAGGGSAAGDGGTADAGAFWDSFASMMRGVKEQG